MLQQWRAKRPRLQLGEGEGQGTSMSDAPFFARLLPELRQLIRALLPDHGRRALRDTCREAFREDPEGGGPHAFPLLGIVHRDLLTMSHETAAIVATLAAVTSLAASGLLYQCPPTVASCHVTTFTCRHLGLYCALFKWERTPPVPYGFVPTQPYYRFCVGLGRHHCNGTWFFEISKYGAGERIDRLFYVVEVGDAMRAVARYIEAFEAAHTADELAALTLDERVMPRVRRNMF